MVAAEKELAPHAQLMKALFERTGPIPDGKAQGEAARWLLSHGYTVSQCVECLDGMMRESWRKGRISLLNVKSEIGTWLLKRGGPRVTEEIEREDEDVFPREAAAELLAALELEPEKYAWQIAKLKQQYSL